MGLTLQSSINETVAIVKLVFILKHFFNLKRWLQEKNKHKCKTNKFFAVLTAWNRLKSRINCTIRLFFNFKIMLYIFCKWNWEIIFFKTIKHFCHKSQHHHQTSVRIIFSMQSQWFQILNNNTIVWHSFQCSVAHRSCLPWRFLKFDLF